LVLLCVVALGACRVDAAVTVQVNSDGSGTVTARATLDADAVRLAENSGAKLEDAVRLSDLKAAGWKSSGWKRLRGGGATLTLSKGFPTAADAGNVVAELNGADGPLRAVRVTREASRFHADWTFAGVADLKDLKTGIASDAELLERLSAANLDVSVLDARLTAQARDALRLRVTDELPNSSATTYRVKPGTTVVMQDSSSQDYFGRMLLVLFGVVLVIAAVGVVIAGAARTRRRRLAAQRPLARSVGLFDDDVD
jgi:hypothetical protein